MNRKLIVSLSIIAALILYLVFVRGDRTSKNLPELGGWEKECTEILIDNKGVDKIKIYKKDNAWVLGDEAFPADKNKVQKMEKTMKELAITDLISEGPYYDRYDLVETKSIRVTIKDGDKILRDILLGKKSSTNRNTYIKFPDKTQIYLASGSLADDFDKGLADFREKEIYTVDESTLESLELSYKGIRLTFTKIQEEVKKEAPQPEKGPQPEATAEKVDKWICKEYKNVALDKNKVESLIDAFKTIKADTFPDSKKESFGYSMCSIKGKVPGKEITLNIHRTDKDKKDYFCTSSESPYVFTLKEYNANRFLKEIKDFTEEKKK